MRTKWDKWKLVVFKACNGYLLVVALQFMAATDGIDWDAFTTFQKVKLFVFMFIAGGKFLDGFFDQTISSMEKSDQLKAYQRGETITTVQTGETKTTEQKV